MNKREYSHSSQCISHVPPAVVGKSLWLTDLEPHSLYEQLLVALDLTASGPQPFTKLIRRMHSLRRSSTPMPAAADRPAEESQSATFRSVGDASHGAGPGNVTGHGRRLGRGCCLSGRRLLLHLPVALTQVEHLAGDGDKR
ncbi:hypothetical protein EYF80_008554 [Liparis tanakae]|uniref:Uncharacterized protein n=1 Tax=Liparis tanakae TaxID=230148 RepID=A0A4Z2ITA3_9TELE|nr:hypothetical protein EYF80_008554 [Liparis tanakae]